MRRVSSEACFVGDAIADPVNGLHLALALQAALNQGGGAVIDLAMRDVLRYAMGDLSDDVVETAKTWQAIANEDNGPLYPMRKPRGVVKELGADNAVWL